MQIRTRGVRAAYAEVVLDRARTLLAASERADLTHITRENISGGHGYWDLTTDALFREPETLEEALLALELRGVLVHAIRNIVYDIIEMPETPEHRLVMKLTLLFNLGVQLAPRDPLIAGAVKCGVHAFAEKLLGISLHEFVGSYASRFCVYASDATGHC
jgi:hypothetical protein